MIDREFLYKNYIFINIRSTINELNNILFNAHSNELKLRQKNQLNSARLFEITDDMNSDPLCDCFKDITLRILDQNIPKFISVEKKIILNQKKYYHCFLFNGEKVIDPTFGQFFKERQYKTGKI